MSCGCFLKQHNSSVFVMVSLCFACDQNRILNTVYRRFRLPNARHSSNKWPNAIHAQTTMGPTGSVAVGSTTIHHDPPCPPSDRCSAERNGLLAKTRSKVTCMPPCGLAQARPVGQYWPDTPTGPEERKLRHLSLSHSHVPSVCPCVRNTFS